MICNKNFLTLRTNRIQTGILNACDEWQDLGLHAVQSTCLGSEHSPAAAALGFKGQFLLILQILKRIQTQEFYMIIHNLKKNTATYFKNLKCHANQISVSVSDQLTMFDMKPAWTINLFSLCFTSIQAVKLLLILHCVSSLYVFIHTQFFCLLY